MRDLNLLPKAHLHVHLESTVRSATLQELGRANGIAVPEHHIGTFDGFGSFAEHNALVRDCLQRPADFSRSTRSPDCGTPV